MDKANSRLGSINSGAVHVVHGVPHDVVVVLGVEVLAAPVLLPAHRPVHQVAAEVTYYLYCLQVFMFNFNLWLYIFLSSPGLML